MGQSSCDHIGVSACPENWQYISSEKAEAAATNTRVGGPTLNVGSVWGRHYGSGDRST